MILRQRVLVCLTATLFLAQLTQASVGDRLPEFQDCVEICKSENCQDGDRVLPLHLRLLFWTCSSECDHVCQAVITDRRIAAGTPQPIVQYHGKWPFRRFLGIQEPMSVLFSLMNLAAHAHGLRRVRASIPASYPLRPYYVVFGYLGLAAWTFSVVFHTRDFVATERADYFAAGASVLYGAYYSVVRIFRLDAAARAGARRAWTALCAALYAAHVTYLTAWRWDYTYNMAANVAIGTAQNLLWSWFSIGRYRTLKKPWAAWPGLIVAWIILAMSLELLDFPPLAGLVDAHSLWHLGTVGPTIWWYSFLVKDAQQDMYGERLKA